MGNRHLDWFRQAEADLRHARHALDTGSMEMEARDAIEYGDVV